MGRRGSPRRDIVQANNQDLMAEHHVASNSRTPFSRTTGVNSSSPWSIMGIPNHNTGAYQRDVILSYLWYGSHHPYRGYYANCLIEKPKLRAEFHPTKITKLHTVVASKEQNIGNPKPTIC